MKANALLRRIFRNVISTALSCALFGLTATIASATPSTQIWIPSTDIQPYKTGRFGYAPSRSRTRAVRTFPPSSTSA